MHGTIIGNNLSHSTKRIALGVAVSFLCFFLFSFTKGWNFIAGPNRVYTNSLSGYLVENAYYIDFGTGNAKKILNELHQYGAIETYNQPFGGSNLSYYRITFTKTKQKEVELLLTLLKHRHEIEEFEGVPLYKIQKSSSQYKHQQSDSWYLKEMDITAQNLKCLSFTHPKVKIAIIDNGFFLSHPNIKGAITQSYDIADDDTDVTPPLSNKDWSHGTMSAGLISGKPINKVGVIGSSLGNAELTVIKVTSDMDNAHDITHGIEGIQKAIDLGVDIIVLSWGAPKDSKIIRKVLQKAKEKNIRIIAAAGNQNVSTPFYPAAYDEVISIGSYDKTYKKARFSNYGTWVKYMVPGTGIPVPAMKDTYIIDEGTSFSAPIYAGVYALFFRLVGDHEQIPKLLTKNTKKVEAIPTIKIPTTCVSIPRDLAGNVCSDNTITEGGSCEVVVEINKTIFKTMSINEPIQKAKTQSQKDLLIYLFLIAVTIITFAVKRKYSRSQKETHTT